MKGTRPKLSDSRLREMAQQANMDEAAFKAMMEAHDRVTVSFLNNVYQVDVCKVKTGGAWPDMLHLSIKRRDRSRVGKEKYRDFMRIKDQLVGPEFEATELYPARSREVDGANQYHLWCFMDPTIRLPFGYASNEGVGRSETSIGGSVQAPFDKGYVIPPADFVGAALAPEDPVS
jgi:hypothetical protein